MRRLILSSHVLVHTAFVSKTALACTAWVLSLAKCQPEHDNCGVMHVMEMQCAQPEVLIQLTKVTPVREQIQWILKIDNYRIVCIKECGVHSHDEVSLLIRCGWCFPVKCVTVEVELTRLVFCLSLLVQWCHHKYYIKLFSITSYMVIFFILPMKILIS